MRAGRYLIALAGVGVLAAGCGTVHVGPSGSVDVLAAAVSTTSAQTARISITEAIQSSGMSLSFTQTGEFDFASSRGMITMTAPIAMTELSLPPKVYIKISGAGSGAAGSGAAGSGALPHGKTWLAIDTGNSGSLDSMLGPFGTGGDPADMLASLTAVAGSERDLGAGTVRGVPVTEYQVNIDPAKLAAKATGPERANLRQFLQSLGKGTIPVDVWVDSQHEVRQVRMSPSMAGESKLTGNMRIAVTLDFYDFGVAVRLSAPPAAQVTTLGPGSTGALSVAGMASGSAVASVGAVASGSAVASAVPEPPAIVTASPAP